MSTERGEAMRAFIAHAGWGGATLAPLAGDASTRRYVRLSNGSHTAMLMDQPQGAETPPCPPDATAEERRALGYNAVARLAGADCARFLAVAEYLRARGLSAPEIYAADPAQGFVLMEDLGDRLYGTVLSQGGDETSLYSSAIDALVRLHLESAPSSLTRDKPLYVYDETAMLAEIDLMTDWFFPLGLGRAARNEEIFKHRELWREALRPIFAASTAFALRDYHSPNLLWLPERQGAARAGIIDFQDAVASTRSYDLISLLEDARRDVTPELAEAMAERYIAAMRAQGVSLHTEHHRAEMAIAAAQRNTRIIGIFARLFKRDSKPHYLKHLPRMWRYLERDLKHPALAPLRAWYDDTVPLKYRSEPRMEGAKA